MEYEKSKRLVIALEPEAAGLTCRQLEVNEFEQDVRDLGANLEPGAKYLVIDAGGICHEVCFYRFFFDKYEG